LSVIKHWSDHKIESGVALPLATPLQKVAISRKTTK
jgi:hypothetical protein